MTQSPRAPVLIEDGDPALDAAAPSPADAPQPDDPARGAAGAAALRLAARGGGGFARWFWGAAAGLALMALTLSAWDFVAALIARNPALGALAALLAGVVALGLALFALREAAGVARLGRLDAVRSHVEAALRASDRAAAAKALAALERLYAGRPDLAWALAAMRSRAPDLIDASALVEHAERTLMAPLDARAAAAAGQAARAVAGATALIPVPAIDVLAALATNLRMIRVIAEIYGGRAGWLGSWRLTRAVAAHLLATGLVALGDDLLGPALGGGLASKLSRRFGEGLVNGALTARVGAAAIAVCRPLPFAALPAPTGRGLAAGALRGLFGG